MCKLESLLFELIIISDSPTSQYRNRYSIFLLTKLCEKYDIHNFEWIFTECGHGKGAPDGVGAAVKRLGDKYVSAGNSLLNSEDLLQAASGSSILCKIVKNVLTLAPSYSRGKS